LSGRQLHAILCTIAQTQNNTLSEVLLLRYTPKALGKSKFMSQRRILRHIVMFGFKSSTETVQIRQVIERFAGLVHLVPGIVDFEWGENNSPEDLSHGLTHCFTLSFESSEDRDAYLPHPEHQAFAEWVGQWVETVTVFDYWATSID